jgi:hypothetical protein
MVPKSQPSINSAEKIAQLVVEASFPGAKMKFNENQSHGECDFDLYYAHGTVAAVEVTESADQNQKWMTGKLNPKNGGSVIKAKHCKKSWMIFATDAKTIPAIREKADEYLAEVEQAGQQSFYWLDAVTTRLQREAGLEKVLPPCVPRCVEDICYDLKIMKGSAISEEGPPKIFISHPVRGGAVGPSVALKAGDRECKKNDNRKKLGAAKKADRHLVVYVDVTNGLPWCALMDSEPPAELPELPEELTHIWLIAYSGEVNSKDAFVVWRASATEIWRKFKISIS